MYGYPPEVDDARTRNASISRSRSTRGNSVGKPARRIRRASWPQLSNDDDVWACGY